MKFSVRNLSLSPSAAVLLITGALAATTLLAQDKGDKPMSDGKHVSTVFSGAKVTTGTVTHMMKDGRHVLTWSDDFKIPDTPAPHWQVVDSKGNVYLLQRLKIKDDKLNRTITLPAYIQDVKKVQIWCAWAEALLGEASFEQPM